MPRPPAPLTSQQRREYTQCFVEHGYCVVRGLLSLDEVSVISSALDSLLATSNAVVRAHGPEIAQQLHIRAAARVAQQESSGGFSRASQLRAGITTACGGNYSVGPPASLTDDERAEAITNPRPSNICTHMVADVGKESALLASFGTHPRLLTLAADVLDGAALRDRGETHMLQIINQAHFKAPGDGVDFPFHQDSVNRGVNTGRFKDVHGNRSYVNIRLVHCNLPVI